MSNDKQAEEVKTSNAEEENSVSTPEETKATSETEVKEEESPIAVGATESEAKAEEDIPNRSEKRIHQLLDKLKAVGQQTEEKYRSSTSETQAVSQPGFQPKDFSLDTDFVPGREYTVEEMNQIIDSRVNSRIQTALSQKDEVDKVRVATDKYADEMEWLMREAPELKNPDFDIRLSEMIVKINSDERGNFLPKMSPKEIYQSLKEIIDKAKVEGLAKASADLHESKEQGAVAPGSGKTQSQDYEADALFDKASDTGRTEDWAELLKKRGFAKK